MAEDGSALERPREGVDQLAVGRDDGDRVAAVVRDPDVPVGVDGGAERFERRAVLLGRRAQRDVDGPVRVAAREHRDRVVAAVGNPDVPLAIRHRSLRPSDTPVRESAWTRERDAVRSEDGNAVVLRRQAAVLKRELGVNARRILKAEVADPDLAARVERDAVAGAAEPAAEVRGSQGRARPRDRT